MDLMPSGHPYTCETETPQTCWLHVSQLQAWPAWLVVDPGPTAVPTAAHSPQPLRHGTGVLHGQKEVLSQPFSAFIIAFFLLHPLLLLFPAGLVLCCQSCPETKITKNLKITPKLLEKISVEASQLNTFGP